MYFSFKRAGQLASLLILTFIAPASHAIDMGAVAVHGAVSATASYSDRFDYLGNTAKRADLNLIETILNGNYRFENGLRISAQLYSYQVGDYTAITLDFASLDYSFSRQMGVRLGRIRHGLGLYGASQDLDMVRPFAYLPLDFYSKTERSFSAAVDGAQIYGNLSLDKNSSLDYQLYAGWVPPVDSKGLLLTASSDTSPFTITGSDSIPIYGGWAAWNTPIEGLRFSASILFLPSITFNGPTRSASSLALATSDARLLPQFLPPGLWDSLVAGKPARLDDDFRTLYFSAEYTRGNWQFAAEAQYFDSVVVSFLPVLGAIPAQMKSDSYYAMATWQAAPKLQFGTYYALGYADRTDRHSRKLISVPAHTGWLKDFAFATSYNLAPWWLVKAEVHLLNGTKGIIAKGNGDAATWKPSWSYVAIKTTLTF